MEIVSGGNPFAAQGGTGVGAVIFDQPHDLFQSHARWTQNLNEQQRYERQLHEAKLARAATIVGDMDFKVDGIMDTDAPYFRDKTYDLQKRLGDIYYKYNGDLSTPDAMRDVQYLNAEKKALLAEAEQSRAQKSLIRDSMAKAASKPEDYDIDHMEQSLAQARLTPLKDRSQYLTENNLLKTNTPNLSELLDGEMKTLKPSVTTQLGSVLPNGQRSVKTVETFPPAVAPVWRQV